jgi:hypothetical protein
MYYRTGNIWLNIIAHGINNAIALTAMYLSVEEPEAPRWLGLVSVVVVIGLFFLFEKISKNQINKPGEEVLIEYEDMNKLPGHGNRLNEFIKYAWLSISRHLKQEHLLRSFLQRLC